MRAVARYKSKETAPCATICRQNVDGYFCSVSAKAKCAAQTSARHGKTWAEHTGTLPRHAQPQEAERPQCEQATLLAFCEGPFGLYILPRTMSWRVVSLSGLRGLLHCPGAKSRKLAEVRKPDSAPTVASHDHFPPPSPLFLFTPIYPLTKSRILHSLHYYRLFV